MDDRIDQLLRDMEAQRLEELPVKISPLLIAVDEESSEVIDFELRFGKWHKIPTYAEHIADTVDLGGHIENILLKPFRNIQADLIYDGEIECKDGHEGLDPSFMDIPGLKSSYPVQNPQNPLFHSENMTSVKEGHYRFRTNYSTLKKVKSPKLGGVRECSPQFKPVIDEFVGIKDNDNAISALRRIYEISLRAKTDGGRSGFFDYDTLITEYMRTGKVDGDCKAISTFTAGLINAIGLRSRIVDGSISEGEEHPNGHVWAEAYVPLDNKRGYWIPVDGSMEVFENFRDKYPVHTLVTNLPLFKDRPVESARLKLKYV